MQVLLVTIISILSTALIIGLIPTLAIPLAIMFLAICIASSFLSACVKVSDHFSQTKREYHTPKYVVDVPVKTYSKNKYYVTSGAIRWTGLAESPSFAALNVVDHSDKDMLDSTVYVDMRGHRTDKAAWSFDTYQLLVDAQGEQ